MAQFVTFRVVIGTLLCHVLLAFPHDLHFGCAPCPQGTYPAHPCTSPGTSLCTPCPDGTSNAAQGKQDGMDDEILRHCGLLEKKVVVMRVKRDIGSGTTPLAATTGSVGLSAGAKDVEEKATPQPFLFNTADHNQRLTTSEMPLGVNTGVGIADQITSTNIPPQVNAESKAALDNHTSDRNVSPIGSNSIIKDVTSTREPDMTTNGENRIEIANIESYEATVGPHLEVDEPEEVDVPENEESSPIYEHDYSKTLLHTTEGSRSLNEALNVTHTFVDLNNNDHLYEEKLDKKKIKNIDSEFMADESQHGESQTKMNNDTEIETKSAKDKIVVINSNTVYEVQSDDVDTFLGNDSPNFDVKDIDLINNTNGEVIKAGESVGIQETGSDVNKSNLGVTEIALTSAVTDVKNETIATVANIFEGYVDETVSPEAETVITETELAKETTENTGEPEGTNPDPAAPLIGGEKGVTVGMHVNDTLIVTESTPIESANEVVLSQRDSDNDEEGAAVEAEVGALQLLPDEAATNTSIPDSIIDEDTDSIEEPEIIDESATKNETKVGAIQSMPDAVITNTTTIFTNDDADKENDDKNVPSEPEEAPEEIVENEKVTKRIPTLEELEEKYNRTEEEEEMGSGEVHPEEIEGDGEDPDHGHPHDTEDPHTDKSKQHHKDTPEDKESKKRTAIIVGVAVGGVALFALAFFSARNFKNRQFKNMKKVPNGDAEGAMEFRPLNTGSTSIYDEGSEKRTTNGLYRQGPKMGPPSPRFARKVDGKFEFPEPDTYAVPNKNRLKLDTNANSSVISLTDSENQVASDPLLRGQDEIKYIDDSTDDEYVNTVIDRMKLGQPHNTQLDHVPEESSSNRSSLSNSPILNSRREQTAKTDDTKV